MKRRIAVLAATLLLVPALIVLPIVKAEIPTVTYWTTLEFSDVLTSYDDIKPLQKAQEIVGVNIEWQHPPVGQEREQFNLLVVSGELPDVVEYSWNTVYPGGAEAALSDGVIIELSEVIEKYMPNYRAYLDRFPEVEKMVKTDTGKHYTIPYIYTATPPNTKHQSISGRLPAYETFLGFFMRRDLLEEYELDVPVTLDDWYNVLKAFKENGVVTPISGVWANILESATFVSAWDIGHDMFVDADGKTVRYGRTEPAYKEFLAYMNKLYEENLLDPDFAIIDGTTLKAKILNQEVGAWTGYTSTYMGVQYDQIHASDPNSKFYPIGITNPKLTEDQTLLYRQASYPFRNNGACITTSCKDIEAVAKWLDFFWTDEGDMLINWGVENESYVFDENGTPVFTEALKNDPNGLSPTNAFAFWRRQNAPIAMDHQTRLMSKGSYTTPESINALYTWETTNGIYPMAMPPVTLLPEETAEYASKMTEIETYANEMRIKFIMGKAPLNEFEQYVQQIQSMGLADVIKIQQAALDRYNAR